MGIAHVNSVFVSLAKQKQNIMSRRTNAIDAIKRLRNCTDIENTTCAVFKHDWYKPPFCNVELSEEQIKAVADAFQLWCETWVLIPLEDYIDVNK